MQEFNFYVDKKVTIWVRENHTVKAETEEQAKEKMISNFKQDETDETFYEQEYVYDTQEYMTPEENLNNATEELYFENGEFLTDNLGNTEI